MKDLVISKQLWNHEHVHKEAQRWSLSPAGRSFLQLSNTQLASLQRAIAGASSVEQFDKRVTSSLEGIAQRQAKSVLNRKVDGETILSSFVHQLKEASKNCLTLKKPDEAKQRAILNSLGTEADNARDAGRLGIRQEFIAALVMIRRSQKVKEQIEERKRRQHADGIPGTAEPIHH